MTYKKDSHEWLRIRVSNSSWFSPRTMRWFGSRIYWHTLTRYKDGWAFISSEGDDYNIAIPRQFTIRFVDSEQRIANDLSGFREFADLESAKKQLAQLIKENTNVPNNN